MFWGSRQTNWAAQKKNLQHPAQQNGTLSITGAGKAKQERKAQHDYKKVAKANGIRRGAASKRNYSTVNIPHLRDLHWGWALLGVSAVGHFRGDSGVGHSRETLEESLGWALQGVFGVRESLGVDRARRRVEFKIEQPHTEGGEIYPHSRNPDKGADTQHPAQVLSYETKHTTRFHLVLRSPWPAFRMLDLLARLIPETLGTALRSIAAATCETGLVQLSGIVQCSAPLSVSCS